MKNRTVSENRKKDNSDNRLVALAAMLLLFLFIIVADVFLVISHDKKMSEAENRVLQQLPQFNMTNIASGKFMAQAEDFVSDQFFGRNGWISAKYDLDVLTGKKESNGILLGKDGYLLEKPALPDMESLNRNIDAVNAFAEKNPELNVVMSIVPNATHVLSELVPKGAVIRNQQDDIEFYKSNLSAAVKYVDLTDALCAHKDEQLYYKSDHHWTSAGARYGFEELAPFIGIQAVVDTYDVYAVSGNFSGTMASNSGSFLTSDVVEIYVPKDVPEYAVEYSDVKEKTATIYNRDALNARNHYEVFMGGNHPKVTIKTVVDTERNLLIFKDSYANCFVQFLIPYYRNIVVVDPRYYTDNIETVISENRITDVLFLYNNNTFVEDNSLFMVLDVE